MELWQWNHTEISVPIDISKINISELIQVAVVIAVIENNYLKYIDCIESSLYIKFLW